MDLALNNLQRLICHKTQQTKPNPTIGELIIVIGNRIMSQILAADVCLLLAWMLLGKGMNPYFSPHN